jgi:hypothetical protein
MSGPTRFQQRTADYVSRRFWRDKDPAKRFLVADEVGLGKTIVARDVIRQTMEHFGGRPLDVVYLCASQPIASQNLKRLKVHGHGAAAKATRLSLLAVEAGSSEQSRYFALTPETSFTVTGSRGHVRERALMFWCLRRRIRQSGFLDMMQLVKPATWARELEALDRHPPNRAITDGFVAAVFADPIMREDIRRLAWQAEALRDKIEPRDFRRARDRMIGRMREKLASEGAAALGSRGLVIVDEFQRFAHLLRPVTDTSPLPERLAARLLSGELPDRRVLLLSATPYRIPGGVLMPGERPYDDFVGLAKFLAGPVAATDLDEALGTFSRALRANPPDEATLLPARDKAQSILRSVMTRTERISFTRDADGMVTQDVRELRPEAGDLVGAVAARRIARLLKSRDPVEYWKSAPYCLEFMKGYDLHTAAIRSEGSERRKVAREAKRGHLLLNLDTLRKLDPLAMPSARQRDLMSDAVADGAEKMLWVPPSLPYLTPAGAFVDARRDLKRLIFTEWRLAPDAIATLTSYEVERRLEHALRRKAPSARSRRAVRPAARHERFAESGDLLRLGRGARDTGDVTLGMTSLALLFPGTALARLGDPLEMALSAGGPVAPADALALTRKRVSGALRKLRRGEGRPDERWYWAAPLLLEDRAAVEEWLAFDDPFSLDRDAPIPETQRLIGALRSMLDNPAQLGRRPANLADTLARLAIGAPGNCAWRSLSRTMEPHDEEAVLRRAAFHAARGLQSLFNQNEATAAVQLSSPGRRYPYWRQVADYCIAGNLQALLDEQLHLEADALAMFEGTAPEKIDRAASALNAALTLRRASLDIRGLERRGRRRKGGDGIDSIRLRCRHALRFAEIKDTDGAVSRLDAVRDAFNSPFRPFLLASTAVGQEGLDFHPWCHAVIHWNLPRSPVELEQREGRVHRYKGHAVRLNVADDIGLSGLANRGLSAKSDPWRTLFELAADRDKESDLAPCWVYERGDATVRIRRIVPIIAMSREQDLWPRLQDRLATYRLVMGLPRQDDLVETLERNGVTATQARAWRIDLAPTLKS